MKQYQYLYVLALLTYIASRVSTYTGALWYAFSVVCWVAGIVYAIKDK